MYHDLIKIIWCLPGLKTRHKQAQVTPNYTHYTIFLTKTARAEGEKLNSLCNQLWQQHLESIVLCGTELLSCTAVDFGRTSLQRCFSSLTTIDCRLCI